MVNNVVKKHCKISPVIQKILATNKHLYLILIVDHNFAILQVQNFSFAPSKEFEKD